LNNNAITINLYSIESTMKFHNEPMLHYKINYPKFSNDHYQRVLNKINMYYRAKAVDQQKFYEDKMFLDAIKQYKESMANNFPFHMYEAIVNYEVTYNQNCTISLYTDKYEFTGGAHGNTVRTSDTWDIHSGNRIMLWQNFN